MMRRLAMLLIGLAALAWPAAGRAQSVWLENPTGDSVLGIPVGKTAAVPLMVYDGCNGLSSYSITVFFDTPRLRLIRVDATSDFPAPTVDTATAGQVTLTATGSSGYCYYVQVATLVFQLDAAAVEGSLLSLRLNQLLGLGGTDLLLGNVQAEVLEICQAIRVYGDVDSSLTVTSRDALIALTHAVGLSVGAGFRLDLGDVDGDLEITSRDALLILSASIGLSLPYGTRAGGGVPNRCAPLQPMPAAMAFWRGSDLYRIATADTIPTPVGVTGYNSYQVSWAPDGSRIAYTNWISGYGYDIMTATPDGSDVDTLGVSTYSDYSPAWSPDGTRIAYISYQPSQYQVFIANADGSKPVQLTSGITVAPSGGLTWSADGRRLAVKGYQVCCSYGLFVIDLVVNANGSYGVTGIGEVFPSSLSAYPTRPAWAPAGDSLVYENGYWGRLFRVAVPGASPGAWATRLYGAQYYPSWITAGLVFRSSLGSGGYYLQRVSDGRHLRLTRSSTDTWGTVARSALTYVDSVAIQQPTDTLFPAETGTFTTLAWNADGAPNTTTPIAWRSRNTSVAVVDSVISGTAYVRGVGLGTTYVVASPGWRSDSVAVVVVSPPAGPQARAAPACEPDGGTAQCRGDSYAWLVSKRTIQGRAPVRVDSQREAVIP